MDAALSFFRTCFNRAMHWSESFEDIAGYFVLEDVLFEHGYRMFGGEIFIVPYEEFVASP
jgi:hypothetical protein